MEARSGKVSILLTQCRKLPDITVAMCIPFKACATCLFALNAHVGTCTQTHTDASADPAAEADPAAALAYAVFETIKNKLIGNPLDVMRARVSTVTCAAQKDMFVVRWNTMGSFSSLRKTCGIVAKCLAPSKMYSKFSINMQTILHGKPSREAFERVAKQFADGITKHSIAIAVAGKINIDEAKLKLVADAVNGKIPEQVSSGSSAANSTPKPHALAVAQSKSDKIFSVKVPYGVESVLLADYLSSKLGIDVLIMGDMVHVLARPGIVNGKLNTLKSGVADYVASRYMRLGDDLQALLAYMAIGKYMCDCAVVGHILKHKMTAASISAAISKHL